MGLDKKRMMKFKAENEAFGIKVIEGYYWKEQKVDISLNCPNCTRLMCLSNLAGQFHACCVSCRKYFILEKREE